MCGLILENGNLALLGASRKKFPEMVDKVIYTFGTVSVTNLKIAVILTTFLVFFLLQFIVNKTKIGMAMRAISYDKFAVPLMGFPIDSVIVFTFILGSSMAGLAGVLFALSYPILDPYMGLTIGWKAFIAAVVGGIGDIRGAFAGGFILGFLEIIELIRWIHREFKIAIWMIEHQMKVVMSLCSRITVIEGEIVTLIGANGAGKTTTLHSICRLPPPEAPKLTGGDILFRGESLIKVEPHDIVRKYHLALVPEGRHIFGNLSVMENLKLATYARSGESGLEDDYQRVFELFPRLAERRKQRSESLSGGEQQMLAVGRALSAHVRMHLPDAG